MSLSSAALILRK
jgi:hypothetical protein